MKEIESVLTACNVMATPDARVLRGDGLTRIMVMVIKVEANDDGVHCAELCRQFSFHQPSNSLGRGEISGKDLYCLRHRLFYWRVRSGNVDWQPQSANGLGNC